jgi:imidazolonepropionase-like amidohydrolase
MSESRGELVSATDRSAAVLYRARGVFDGVSVIGPAAGVLVDGGRVIQVGDAAELAGTAHSEHDFGTAVIVPGFVDAHTHVTLRPGEGDQDGQSAAPAAWQTIRGFANLRRMLASGVTTARIMTEEHRIDLEYRAAIERGEVTGPRLLVSGAGLSPPGGHGCSGPGVTGIEPLRAAVRSRAQDMVDHIKVFMTGGVSSADGALMEPQYSQSEITAVVEEAAEHGLKVSAHAHGGPGVAFAVAAGVHSIEHGVMLSAEDARAMAERGIRLVLTTTILHHPDGLERGDGANPAIMAKIRQGREASARTAALVRESGVEIAVGTDSMHGLFGYELSWLVEQGWSPREALAAATSGGAALLEHDDIGVLRHGSRADFVVLAGDPLDDIAAVRDVVAVYQDGRRVA